MRKLLLVIAFLQYLTLASGQSIVVNPSGHSSSDLDAEDLLTNVLLDGGSCSASSNFQLKDNFQEPFPNANRSWGFFQKGNSNFPFEEGIVLTTGYAKDAEGPDSGIVSKGSYGWVGDSDATALAGNTTNNATIFEFDFVPQGDEISFNYIFASEEYPQYACSTYNDVFGFIISGPGITPDPGLSGKNIALLPNGDPVTINNVNDDFCGDDTYYVAGPFQDIEYGGRTTPLTAQASVIPGETYHIRLLIADTSDINFDSAVFLEAGSFHLGVSITDESGVDLGDDLFICGEENYTLYVNTDNPDANIQWFFNGDPIPGATSNSVEISESGTYGVEVSDGDCSNYAEINVVFGELPVNDDTYILEEVDFDGDGFATFNLTEIEPLVLDDLTGITFEYYPTMADAENQTNEITNPTAFEAEHNTIVYGKVMDGPNCNTIVKIILRVLEDCINPTGACPGDDFGLNIPFQDDGEIPEWAPSASDYPGLFYGCLSLQPYPRFFYIKVAESGNLEFDMTQYSEPDEQGTPLDVDFAVWGPYSSVPCSYGDLDQDHMIDCSYSASEFEHVSIPNAQAGEIYILLITNWAGYSPGEFGYVNLVFDEENSSGSFDCSVVTGETEYGQCDDDKDGQVTFDLESIANDITGGDEFLEVTFYSDENDAENDTDANVIPTGPFTVTTAESPVEIYAQVKDNVINEISEIVTITLRIYDAIEDAHDGEFFACDTSGVGIEVVDLTSIDIIDNPQDYNIRYYENEEDAEAGNAGNIDNPQNYSTGTTTIYVRIENDFGCYEIVMIHIDISELEVHLGDDISVCEGDVELVAQGPFEGQDGVVYVWERDGETLAGETEQTLVVTEPGTYTVFVTQADGCSGSDTVVVSVGELEVDLGENFSMCVGEFEVTATGDFAGYETATYHWTFNGEEMDVDGPTIIVDQIGNYTLTVETEWGCTGTDTLVVSQGIAPTITEIHVGPDYVQITAVDGEEPYEYSMTGVVWQDSNQFNHLPPGTYTVYVKTAEGCVTTDEFAIFDIPTMFTPNGDGINDTWNIKGLEVYPGSNIQIYDRAGRMVYESELNSGEIWDGYFKNGQKAPTQDYWYVMNITDGRKFTGHVTVKSRGEKY